MAIYNNKTIIGASGYDDNAGSGYVFEYNETNESWIEVSKLRASDPNSYDEFGHGVDICGDLVMVGSEDEGADVFEYNRINDTWNEIAKIFGHDANNVGVSVSISNNFAATGSDTRLLITKISDLYNPSLVLNVDYNYSMYASVLMTIPIFFQAVLMNAMMMSNFKILYHGNYQQMVVIQLHFMIVMILSYMIKQIIMVVIKFKFMVF